MWSWGCETCSEHRAMLQYFYLEMGSCGSEWCLFQECAEGFPEIPMWCQWRLQGVKDWAGRS